MVLIVLTKVIYLQHSTPKNFLKFQIKVYKIKKSLFVTLDF